MHAKQAGQIPVSYTHLRAHETVLDLVCRLLLDKKHTRKDTSRIKEEQEKQQAILKEEERKNKELAIKAKEVEDKRLMQEEALRLKEAELNEQIRHNQAVEEAIRELTIINQTPIRQIPNLRTIIKNW